MSIKRISRRRVAAPIYIDDEPMATRVGTKEDIRGNTSVDVTTNATRTGGNVETKMDPPALSGLGGDIESRVGTVIDTRAGTNVETRTGTNVETRSSTTEPSGGRDVPQMSKWSV